MANEKHARSSLQASVEVGAAFLTAGTQEIVRLTAERDEAIAAMKQNIFDLNRGARLVNERADRAEAERDAARREVERLRADEFTENELRILLRLTDRYTEAAYRDLPADDPSHRVRVSLRDKLGRHLIARQEGCPT